MKTEDFDFLSRMLRERSGLVLTPEKIYLLETRLGPIAKRLGLAGIDALVAALRHNPDIALLRQITEAMTTNETFFFRDTKPFEQFRRLVLPGLLASRAKSADRTLRIWCAASSSGQEPYSLAMICREEAARLAGWKVQILATDISREMIERAREGIYTQFEVQRGLPAPLLIKYFAQDGERWQIKPEIRAAVQYREFNLLDDPRMLGRFDIVFCRNVLIYFDQPTKQKVLDRAATILAADGALFLGAAETVIGVSQRFAPVTDERGVYRPVADVAKAGVQAAREARVAVPAMAG